MLLAPGGAAVDLPQIRLHDLRHTHETLALQAAIHPKAVSERLGHATVSITLDTYSHAIPAVQEEAPASNSSRNGRVMLTVISVCTT
jgi:integrase